MPGKTTRAKLYSIQAAKYGLSIVLINGYKPTPVYFVSEEERSIAIQGYFRAGTIVSYTTFMRKK